MSIFQCARWRSKTHSAVSAAIVATVLTACGGGGGGGGNVPQDPNVSDAAQTCAATNPYLADASSAVTIGSLDNEKAWLHTYMNGAYLWYSEMPSVDPGLAQYSSTADVYGSMDNYFQDLKTPSLTGSGKRRDQFSFTYPTKAWSDLINAGTESGYGISWTWASPTPPRGIQVAYVEQGSPAAAAGVLRGDVLLTADGVDADDGTSAGVDTLNAALFPSSSGQSHAFVFSRQGANVGVALISAVVTKHPVPNVSVINAGVNRRVGYILFNDHLASAEQPLIDAVQALKNAAVTDLVLDLRYNGGGYLYIASELAYMIAGGARTTGQVFEQLQYNDKRSADTNSADSRTPFYDTSCILDANYHCTNQAPLPTLNLTSVTVITSGSTCSASEAVINGLRGVDVDVRLIGDTTCGKPYGFTAHDNCGISYFPIEFQGNNAKGFGDYADGFAANCPATDDFSHALGDTNEGMLSAALYSVQNNACQLAAAQSARRALSAGRTWASPRLIRGPEKEARVVIPRR